MMIEAAIQLVGMTRGSAGGWMGADYALSLCAATFPAWTLFTLLRSWMTPQPVKADVLARRYEAKRL
jgi:hypothetical protein